VLIRTFVMLWKVSSIHLQWKPAKSRTREHQAFSVLASVCWYWRQTLIGWPQSSSPKWVKHRLRKVIVRINSGLYCCTVCGRDWNNVFQQCCTSIWYTAMRPKI